MAAPRTLSPETVIAMRAEAAAGASAAALARRYGVGCTSAERILRGETYREIEGPTSPPVRRGEPLSEKMVIAIREKRAAGKSVADIAREFGITRQMCDRIARGITYADAPGPIVASGEKTRRVPRITLLAAAILVRRNRAFSIDEIAELMGVSRNAADKRVERMIEQDYLRRAIFDPSLFDLTKDGRDFVVAIVKATQTQQERLTE
jgi:predicted transcriptional regulator